MPKPTTAQWAAIERVNAEVVVHEPVETARISSFLVTGVDWEGSTASVVYEALISPLGHEVEIA